MNLCFKVRDTCEFVFDPPSASLFNDCRNEVEVKFDMLAQMERRLVAVSNFG